MSADNGVAPAGGVPGQTGERCSSCGVDVGIAENPQSHARNVCSVCVRLCGADWRSDDGHSEIIYAPEFSQAEINALAIVCWLAVDAGGEIADIADEIIGDLQSRNVFVRSVVRKWVREADIRLQEPFGFTARLLGQALATLPENTVEQRRKWLGGLRLLPNKKAFSQEFEYWRAYYGAMVPSWQWGEIAPGLARN